VVNFTPAAEKRWSALPSRQQFQLLNNVWCAGCANVTTIVNLVGRMHRGHLVLEGQCERCGGSVARLIEHS
jgi:hypothetical protein